MISVIIPTLNEKKNILKIANKLNKIKIVSQVIFVDDNSIDGTFAEIKKIKFTKFCGYLRKSKQRDLSQSVVYGVDKANNKNILVMDCDLQHDVKYIGMMWKLFIKSNYDVIVASRFKRKKFIGNISFLRSLISKFAIFLINSIFGTKSSDPLSGFFLCKKNLINAHKKNFFLRGYKILFDVIYNSKRNINVKDVEISFKKRNFEKSKFNIRVIWLFLRQMLYTKLVVKK